MGYKILQIQKSSDVDTLHVLVDFGNGQTGSVMCSANLDANGIKSCIDAIESGFTPADPTLSQEIKDLIGYEKV